MSTIILHHYWGSPYAEKIRLLLAYHLVWWLRAPPARQHLLAASHLAWADRMAAFGHGSYQPVSAQEALAAVQAGQRTVWAASWPQQSDARLGSTVSIVPDDYGRTAVSGRLVDSTQRHVSIERAVPGLGAARIHFPRLGYEITSE